MNYALKSSYNEEKNVWSIAVTGEVDIFNSGDFKEALISLTEEKQIDLEIDCKNLDYIDSTALGALVAVFKAVKVYDGNITLIGLKQSLAKLFVITSLDKSFIMVEGDKDE